MKIVTSKDNPGLKAVRALVRSKKERQEASAFVMEGVRALSALAEGTALPQYRLKEIWVSSDSPGRAAEFNVPVYAVPQEMMAQISDCRTSQGLLGVVEYAPEPPDIQPERGNYLLLDGVADPGNLGTLVRSAVAFGFNGVFLHGDTAEVFNPKAVRATMGALPFCRHWRTGAEIFQVLERAGYELVSTVVQGGEDLYAAEFGPKNVLVIGSEAHGVSAEVLRRTVRRLSIPMSASVESLNAAAAGSICMSKIFSNSFFSVEKS